MIEKNKLQKLEDAIGGEGTTFEKVLKKLLKIKTNN